MKANYQFEDQLNTPKWNFPWGLVSLLVWAAIITSLALCLLRRQLLVLSVACVLASCAQTILYQNGEKIACFQGDMTKVHYENKDIRWDADTVNHSAATLAQGEAAKGKITAAGVAAASAYYLIP